MSLPVGHREPPPPAPRLPAPAAPPKIVVEGLSVRYGTEVALRPCSLAIAERAIHVILGPSGSGKTSLLRALNLLAVEFDGATLGGRIQLDGQALLEPAAGLDGPSAIRIDPLALRRRVGMVFAEPQILPRSIFDNVVYGPRLAGVRRRAELEAMLEEGLRAAQLWDEVKDRLGAPARALSVGQQQRLCLARALALRPEVLLLDEPCSGLDPISTLRVEEALRHLRQRMTFVLVTSNSKQAARVGDRVSFFLVGELVEDAPVEELFTAPADRRTNDYLSGRIG